MLGLHRFGGQKYWVDASALLKRICGRRPPLSTPDYTPETNKKNYESGMETIEWKEEVLYATLNVALGQYESRLQFCPKDNKDVRFL